jgi:hypothetical protein
MASTEVVFSNAPEEEVRTGLERSLSQHGARTVTNSPGALVMDTGSSPAATMLFGLFVTKERWPLRITATITPAQQGSQVSLSVTGQMGFGGFSAGLPGLVRQGPAEKLWLERAKNGIPRRGDVLAQAPPAVSQSPLAPPAAAQVAPPAAVPSAPAMPAPGGRACAGCGAPLDASAKFCPQCGAPAPKEWACPSCGAAASGGRFCVSCGAALASAPVREREREREPEPGQESPPTAAGQTAGSGTEEAARKPAKRPRAKKATAKKATAKKAAATKATAKKAAATKATAKKVDTKAPARVETPSVAPGTTATSSPAGSTTPA